MRSLTVLGEAWAELRITEHTSFRAWRQTFDLPYLNRNDSRMIPNTFQAYALGRRHEELGFVAGHVAHIKLRGSGGSSCRWPRPRASTRSAG